VIDVFLSFLYTNDPPVPTPAQKVSLHQSSYTMNHPYTHHFPVNAEKSPWYLAKDRIRKVNGRVSRSENEKVMSKKHDDEEEEKGARVVSRKTKLQVECALAKKI
jgi:hypothetical protein